MLTKELDPVPWIERLMVVNEKSQFSAENKKLISAALLELAAKLEKVK